MIFSVYTVNPRKTLLRVRPVKAGNADSVAEIGIYLMIGLSRDVRNMELSIANRRVWIPRDRALSGKTVGIVGLGGIGGALSRRLKAFDCRVGLNGPRLFLGALFDSKLDRVPILHYHQRLGLSRK